MKFAYTILYRIAWIIKSKCKKSAKNNTDDTELHSQTLEVMPSTVNECYGVTKKLPAGIIAQCWNNNNTHH